jgi:hypothetical protein
MIDTLHIENFRCFKSLDLPALRRINVIVGKNASGKSALLEGVKIALDAFPGVLPWLNNFRSVPTFLPPNPTTEQFQSLFLDFFHEFNVHEQIVTFVRDSEGRTASLRIQFDPKRAVTSQPGLGFQPQPPPPVTIVPLAFERTDFQGQKSAPCATINPQGQLFLEPARPMGISSGLISNTYFGGPGENAQWLSQLSVEKRSGEVLDAIQRHFPFIRAVTSETSYPGISTVYADLPDLPRKLPLSVVSSGISRLFTFILSIVQQTHGVVLIDEIENGIFHDRYQLVWETVADLARRHDTQLFITTHSKECLRAAVPIIAKAMGDFSLLRINRERASSTVEFFGGEQMEAALEKNGEVRD